MIENWSALLEFPGYRVSDLGRVQTVKGSPIFPWLADDGFLMVTILDESGEYVAIGVHILVGRAFLANYDQGIVKHRDRHKFNNVLENLEVLPVAASSKKGFTGKSRPVRHLDTGVVYQSQREAARVTGISLTAINYILAGRRVRINDRFEYVEASNV